MEQARTNGFTINWTYTDDNTALSYNIYRHIENKISGTANGGVNNNPTTNQFQSNYKLIATVDKGTFTYTDNWGNMSVHADEGILFDGTKWIDTDGKDVKEEIYTAKRRIYYKIEAKSSTVGFNDLPFIYTAHTDGVECRSIVTQVYDNTLYNEGDVVWLNNTLGSINRIAVDTTYDITRNRMKNVWASGNNKIYCLNGDTGAVVYDKDIAIGNILALRVDPDTGNAIFIGNSSTVYKISALTGVISNLFTTTVPTTVNNNGLVIAKENNNHYAYTINNFDNISRIGIDSASRVDYPRTNFGCSSTTITPTIEKPLPNILGITNGADGGVWVNGHTPIHYKYSYTTTSVVTVPGPWIGVCFPDGNIDSGYASQWNNNHQAAINAGLLGYATCVASKHKPDVTTTTTNTYYEDVNFLQDIGYIYGVTTNVNNSATNGQLFPYTVSGANIHYYPFTSSSQPYRTALSWVGTSPNGGDSGGRPFMGDRRTPTPKDNPIPIYSQKGLAASYPSFGILSGNSYNIYQVNEIENKVHKLTWNGSNTFNESNRTAGLYYNSLTPTLSTDYWNVTNPVHINVDTQNNIWVTQELPSLNALTLIYNLESSTAFSSGGLCTYPALPSSFATSSGRTTDYSYGNNGNNPYIEFYLTRNLTFASGATARPTQQYLSSYGVKLSGTLGDQTFAATNWCNTNTNYASAGKRVYPNYISVGSQISFPRIAGNTTEYNSDNIGTSMLFATQNVITEPDFIHPPVIYPVVLLNVNNPTYDNVAKCDKTFWKSLTSIDTTFTKVSGYDNLKTTLSATMITSGSFSPNGYTFNYRDKTIDIGTIVPNTISTTTVDNTIVYTYNDPSINGKPYQPRWTGGPAESIGKFIPYCTLNFDQSCYLLSGDPIITSVSSNTVDVNVFERWPTANFNITPFDTASIRVNSLTSWNVGTASAYPVGNNGLVKTDANRVVWGYDPLSAQFNDTTTTGSWPISAWHWTFGDKPTYLGFTLPQLTTYLNVTSATLTASLSLSSISDDCLTERKNVVEHLYMGPGKYYATLWVAASNTGTSSWNVSAGVTDETYMYQNFTVAATREIDVLEVCPALTFTILSGETVTPLFNDDGGLSPIVSANHFYNNNISTNYEFISGYAPYLKIQFNGSISGRSLPLSASVWNYSDYYVNPLPTDTTYFNPPTSGWPIWTTESYKTTGIHTFVMPGFYNISLQPIVSAESGYVSNCSAGLRQNMQVYVKEIMPICKIDVTVPPLSSTPLTVSINPSATFAGSFPICRMEYDFGDGTEHITISRIISASYADYYNTSAYLSNLADPRNFLMTHNYHNTVGGGIFTLNVSAYACNTNSVATTSFDIGPLVLPSMQNIDGDVHLIENRMYQGDNDVLLVFEGTKSTNNYTLLLSST
jgi:hypothetical protein